MPNHRQCFYLLKLVLALLFGLVLAGQGIFEVASGAMTVTTPTQGGCSCSRGGCQNCPTPACCVSPSLPTAPLLPDSLPAPVHHEWQLLATPVNRVVLQATPPTASRVRTVSFFFSVPSLPLFQRDCSYLI